MFKTISGVLLAAVALSATAAQAAPPDLHTGTFSGRWCGYQAVFKIQSKEQGRWVFHGLVVFPTYDNLADELWIEQYEDNSLRMIRYLSADQAGGTQVVQTYPPLMHDNGGSLYPEWKVETANGPDCEGKTTKFSLR